MTHTEDEARWLEGLDEEYEWRAQMADATVNPEENYRTAKELQEIAKVIEFADNTLSETTIEVAVFDINGESLGYLRMTPNGNYGLYTEKAKVSPF